MSCTQTMAWHTRARSNAKEFNFTDVKTEKETVYDKRDQCCRVMKGDSFVVIIKRNQLKYTNAQDDVPAIIKFYNDRAKMSVR